jgi:hypothetical protein
MNLRFPAPDGRQRADFLWEAPERRGPAWFRLRVNGWDVPGLFGDAAAWSPDSSYLALQRLDRAGPVTSLTVVDVRRRALCAIERAEGGFVVPVRFDGDALVFEIHLRGNGVLRKRVTLPADLSAREWALAG